ncbi:MAG: substrate-binding domain-containing protein [Bdellovibrionales bacterium]|nr:substrate-binding domain-containing protein [Bdellovibrionales bacterium]
MGRMFASSLAALVTVASLVGCTGKKSASTTGKVKVGFILATLQEERYAKDKKFFEDKAQSLGAEVVFAAANNSEQEQLAKVENVLSQGVKVLVVQPVNSNAASSFVTMAHRDGVKVIAYDRVINNAPLDLYVTQDSYKVGVLQAEAAAAFTHGKGNYIILRGESGHSVANEITRGVEDTLKKFPDIKVVVNQAHAGWSPDLAMKTVENALTVHKNKIDAILANNSGMANGAVQALAEQKLLGKVFIGGADADLTAMKNLVADRQQFEVLKAIQPLADAAAEAAVKLAKGEALTVEGKVDVGGGNQVPVLNTPVFPIQKADIEEKIIKSGFHTREEIYGRK